MIEVNVKTTWQGKVALREKYVHEALDTGQGIRIVLDSSFMDIPADEVKKKIVARSENSFFDKFSGERHFLVYFKWDPIINETLF